MKKKKTSTKKGSSSPVWNEALSFDVTEEDLKHCHLVVSVVNCHHGHSPLLGTCVLGHRGHGQGSVHWDTMVQNARKSTAMWHQLYIWQTGWCLVWSKIFLSVIRRTSDMKLLWSPKMMYCKRQAVDVQM